MPGIANCTVPRLRAQPGSLLSLLPVQNVKDQPVGGSRREQSHTLKCTYTCSTAQWHTCVSAYASMRIHWDQIHPRSASETGKHTHTPHTQHTHSPHRHTVRPGSSSYHIMRAPARPSHEPSAEMIQGSPLSPHSISQVELHSRVTAELQHSLLKLLNVEINSKYMSRIYFYVLFRK